MGWGLFKLEIMYLTSNWRDLSVHNFTTSTLINTGSDLFFMSLTAPLPLVFATLDQNFRNDRV